MTLHVYPIRALTNTARATRGAMSLPLFGATAARPLGARSGVRYGTPTTTVSLVAFAGTVKPHAGVMDVQTSAETGGYWYAVTANETFTVSAAHATLARVDVVTVRIDDPDEDGTGSPQAVVVYKAGTAAGSPVAPTPTTTREMVIANINVPASGGGNPTVSWVAPYAVAAGGIIPVRNTTERGAMLTTYGSSTGAPLYVHRADATAGSRLEVSDDNSTWAAVGPASSYNYDWANAAARTAQTGMLTGYKGYQRDTAIVYRYDGSAWKEWESDWITYTPTFASTVVGTGGTHTGRYRWEQGRVRVQTFTVLGTSGFTFSGYVFALPVTAVTPHSQYGSYPSSASFDDVSASVNYEGYVSANNVSTTQAAVLLLGTNGARVGPNSTTPFTWAAGDKAKTDFMYDPA